MTPYLVTYDLKREKDYPTLWAELKRMGSHRTLLSVWLVASNFDADGLITHLSKFVDSDDKLWATEITKNYQFKNANGGTNDWMSRHPPLR